MPPFTRYYVEVGSCLSNRSVLCVVSQPADECACTATYELLCSELHITVPGSYYMPMRAYISYKI